MNIPLTSQRSPSVSAASDDLARRTAAPRRRHAGTQALGSVRRSRLEMLSVAPPPDVLQVCPCHEMRSASPSGMRLCWLGLPCCVGQSLVRCIRCSPFLALGTCVALATPCMVLGRGWGHVPVLCCTLPAVLACSAQNTLNSQPPLSEGGANPGASPQNVELARRTPAAADRHGGGHREGLRVRVLVGGRQQVPGPRPGRTADSPCGRRAQKRGAPFLKGAGVAADHADGP